MGDETTSWRSDPFGTHELRFFSADGKPTLLVMDGGRTSYDRPPRQGPPSQREPRSGSESTRPLNRERPSAGSPVSTTEPEPPSAPPSSQPPTIATVVVQQMGSVFTAAAPMSVEGRDAVDPGHLRPPAPLVITELADDRSAPPVEQMDRAVEGDAGTPMSRPLKSRVQGGNRHLGPERARVGVRPFPPEWRHDFGACGRDNDNFISYERNAALCDDDGGTANCVESGSRSGSQRLGVELVDRKQNGSAHRGDNVRSSDTLCRALYKRDGH